MESPASRPSRTPDILTPPRLPFQKPGEAIGVFHKRVVLWYEDLPEMHRICPIGSAPNAVSIIQWYRRENNLLYRLMSRSNSGETITKEDYSYISPYLMISSGLILHFSQDYPELFNYFFTIFIERIRNRQLIYDLLVALGYNNNNALLETSLPKFTDLQLRRYFCVISEAIPDFLKRLTTGSEQYNRCKRLAAQALEIGAKKPTS